MLLYQQSQGTSNPLNLDAPINQYLRNTGSFKLPPRWAHLTTRELLAMTSGIMDVGQPPTWQEEAQESARGPLLYKPGTQSSYSDVNYDLLGELIEQRTGEKYGTFIQNQFLTPLGMSQTQELGHSPTVSNQAVGYNGSRHGRWPKAAAQNGPQMYAAAGMVSTAQDMARYMTALLSGQFLDSATYQLMWTSTPTPQFGAKPATDAVRGLGWDNAIDSSDGPVQVTKSGDVPGYTSQLILDPQTDSGVFISFNAAYHGRIPQSGGVAYQVAESILQASQTGSAPGG